MLLPAPASDAPLIEAFLRAHMATAMFPLSNLFLHGMEGGHDRAMHFWTARSAGAITDVLGMTMDGMVMPNCPQASAEELVEALKGQNLMGLIGPARQCRPLHATLGLATAPRALDRDEPHFALPLSQLTVPEGPGTLQPLTAAEPALLEEWILTYDMEALGSTMSAARTRAPETLARYIDQGSHRVLMDGDQALAMSGFNAEVGACVQIGGVFTPADQRGQGHARRCVALHLAEARAQGKTDATLFSANDAASRAYRAIGFERFGDWTICLLEEPFHV